MNYSVSFRSIFGTNLSNEKMAELLHFVETDNGKMILLIVIVFEKKMFCIT
jgi:hypothetical protein